MKNKTLKTSFILLVFFTSCRESQTNTHSGVNSIERKFLLTQIHYDFDNLKLYLNSSISNSNSDGFWRWDYMNSDNGGPDSIGVDYFMNISQPVFSYNQEETLPCLSIKTNKNKIIEFSVTVIFNLTDNKPESIRDLLDSLTKFDLCQDEKIKQSIIDHGIYKDLNTDFEETIELVISQEKYGYDRITYEVKNKTPNSK